ncbi:DUF4870 domain-containing protein [uncultured Amnibacterium sp.]|uniref:DUF4870 domain-containing protein n=1 Tax=uncultured Amnibacterium sp. TaxID=1631851 RepID=UPI0035CBF324
MTNDLPPSPDPSNGVPPNAAPPNAVPDYSAPVPGQPLSPSDERLYMTLANIGGIFFSFIPALIVYLIAKDRSAFVKRNAASALNFQITMAIISVVGYILWIILVGILVTIAVSIVVLIFSILAAVAANRGTDYRYPLSIPFVK